METSGRFHRIDFWETLKGAPRVVSGVAPGPDPRESELDSTVTKLVFQFKGLKVMRYFPGNDDCCGVL